MEQKPSPQEPEQLSKLALILVFGVAAGIVIGSFINNIALGVIIGGALGIVYWMVFSKSKKSQ